MISNLNDVTVKKYFSFLNMLHTSNDLDRSEIDSELVHDSQNILIPHNYWEIHILVHEVLSKIIKNGENMLNFSFSRSKISLTITNISFDITWQLYLTLWNRPHGKFFTTTKFYNNFEGLFQEDNLLPRTGFRTDLRRLSENIQHTRHRSGAPAVLLTD